MALRLLTRLRHRARALFRGQSVDHELARELRAHLDEEADALVAQGLTREAARREAQRAFGAVSAVADECRDTRRVNLIDHLQRDLRLAVRGLRRQPGLLATTALSIGLGVAANLTVVSLASQLVLSVPSAERPDQLVRIRTGNGSHVSYSGWRQLDESGALAGIAGYQFEQSVNWRLDNQSATLVPLLVTANFFDVIGVPVARGRGFTAAEAAADRDPRVVVVSDGFWRARLASDPDVVGRALTLDGEAYVVTGVLAPRLRSIAGYGLAPEVYLPLNRSLVPALHEPRHSAAALVGRLRSDQSLPAARAALEAAAERIGEADGDQEFKIIREMSPVGGLAQARDMREVALFFVVLAIISGLVLAIACANVAGVLFARGLARGREMALRAALGASRRRLVQQLLVESLVLAAAGSAVGAVLTWGVFLALARIQLPLPLPFELRFEIDWRTMSASLALMIVCACLAGLAPSLTASRRALVTAIGRHARPSRWRRVSARGVLVGGQVAVSLLLVVTALTFARNVVRAAVVDTGMDVDRLLVMQVSFVEGRQGPVARPVATDVVARVRSVPGIADAAFAEGAPLTIFAGGSRGTEMRLGDADALTRVEFDILRTGPGYFATMGFRVVRGRDFTEADGPGASAAVVINEEFARRYFPGVDPIGRTLSYAGNEGPRQTVVGVVSNGKYRSLAEAQNAAVYEPVLQAGRSSRFMHVLVRTHGPPEAMVGAVRDAAMAVDSSAATKVEPMRSALAFALLPSQLGAGLVGTLGGLGTVLAMVGLFGVVAFTVQRRAREIAIRVALGAPRRAVVRLVLAHALRLVVVGGVAGLLLSALVAVPLSAFLVEGVSPADPSWLVVASLLLLAASLAAVWSPVRRALRVAPASVLKLE